MFAALSTAALAPIAKERITAATGLYNVVRQVMGSIGIALAATLLTRSQAQYHAVLAEDAAGTAAQQWLAGAAAGLQHLGTDVATAHERALRMLDMLVSRQATVLAYNHILFLVAAMFAIVVPLALLLRRGTSGGDGDGEIIVD